VKGNNSLTTKSGTRTVSIMAKSSGREKSHHKKIAGALRGERAANEL
jgi:hypothetical protein